jgi:hypothetical protein
MSIFESLCRKALNFADIWGREDHVDGVRCACSTCSAVLRLLHLLLEGFVVLEQAAGKDEADLRSGQCGRLHGSRQVRHMLLPPPQQLLLERRDGDCLCDVGDEHSLVASNLYAETAQGLVYLRCTTVPTAAAS